MGALDLLADLIGAGFTASAEGGRVVIRPASLLTDDLRAAVVAAKPELLALLAEDLADRAACEERAAIMEFDGGLSRADAEVAARACITCEFESRHKTCLEPVLAGLAPTFGIRFCEQVPGAGADCMAYKEKTQ